MSLPRRLRVTSPLVWRASDEPEPVVASVGDLLESVEMSEHGLQRETSEHGRLLLRDFLVRRSRKKVGAGVVWVWAGGRVRYAEVGVDVEWERAPGVPRPPQPVVVAPASQFVVVHPGEKP